VIRLGVLASGRGSNLQAIIDAIRGGLVPARIAVVIADRERALALDRARAHAIPAVFLDPGPCADRAAYDQALVRRLRASAVDLVCLAGFMRVLGPGFVRAFAGRVMNVHPSLLPAFPGLHAQRQALEHGVKVAGATVHFVDEGVDTGPIVLQEAVPVLDGDTEDSLSERILAAEHRIYPEAIRLFAAGRLRIVGRRVLADGAPDQRPVGPADAAPAAGHAERDAS
jgi:phosphoribosylglycinamide formyltransferase-1